MIKQISLIALVITGIGTLFLGTILTQAFTTVPPGHTGNAHGVGGKSSNRKSTATAFQRANTNNMYSWQRLYRKDCIEGILGKEVAYTE